MWISVISLEPLDKSGKARVMLVRLIFSPYGLKFAKTATHTLRIVYSNAPSGRKDTDDNPVRSREKFICQDQLYPVYATRGSAKRPQEQSRHIICKRGSQWRGSDHWYLRQS